MCARDASPSEDSDAEDDGRPTITPAPPKPLTRKQLKAQKWRQAQEQKQQQQQQQQQRTWVKKKEKRAARHRQRSPSTPSDSSDASGDGGRAGGGANDRVLYPKLDPHGRSTVGLQARNSARAERFGDGTVSRGRTLAAQVTAETREQGHIARGCSHYGLSSPNRVCVCGLRTWLIE